MSSIRRTVLGASLVLGTVSIGVGSAAADEFQPAAQITDGHACEDGVYQYTLGLLNVTGLDSADFVVTADTGDDQIFGVLYTVPAGGAQEIDLTFAEGFLGTVHVTSNDAIVPIDYHYSDTADCAPDATEPLIPETTVTTAVGSGGELPHTGSSDTMFAVLAGGLLLGGFGLVRMTRRAA